jgi:cysteine synthase B
MSAGYLAFDDILSAIGGTPAIHLHKTCESRPDVKVYAKLEGFNPNGSAGDRVALKMIVKAEQDGKLKPGDTIIEATAGNTGVGLAMVGCVKGYKVVVTIPESASEERRRFLAAYGAEIILTPAKDGLDGAIRKAREIVAANPGQYFYTDQYSNPANSRAHYEGTAEEIWRQSYGKVTHFVAPLGSSGTIAGVGKRLRERNEDIKIIEAQPVQKQEIEGLKGTRKGALIPRIYEPANTSHRVLVETEQAYQMARRIALEEGIFVGASSGAALAAVLEILPKVPKESVIFVLFPDRGDKYLSTPQFPYVDPPLPEDAPAPAAAPAE